MFGVPDNTEQVNPAPQLISDVSRLIQELFIKNAKERGRGGEGLSCVFRRYDYKKDGSEKLYEFELLLFAPNGGYVTVATRPVLSDTERGEWTIHSHHDSCWRYDGVDFVVRYAYMDGFSMDSLGMQGQTIIPGIVLVDVDKDELAEARRKDKERIQHRDKTLEAAQEESDMKRTY